MGLVRTLGTHLALRALKATAKTVAKKKLDQFAAKAVTDASLKTLLNSCLDEALAHACCPPDRLAIQAVGTDGAFTPYRLGWCVHVQNFDRLAAAKASRDDRWVRMQFGAVQYTDAPEPWLEVLVWHPSHGPVGKMTLVFKAEADPGRAMFVQLLTTALNITSAST